MTTADRERRARRAAARIGLRLHKSRSPHRAYAPYMLSDLYLNVLVSQEHCTLDEIEGQISLQS